MSPLGCVIRYLVSLPAPMCPPQDDRTDVDPYHSTGWCLTGRIHRIIIGEKARGSRGGARVGAQTRGTAVPWGPLMGREFTGG